MNNKDVGLMDFGQRIRKVREHRKLKGENFADLLGLTKQALSMIETGKRGVSADLLYLISKHYDIDPRFFFGMMDSVEDADLTKNTVPTSENIIRILSNLERKVTPPQDIDPLAHRVTVDVELRNIVKLLAYEEGGIKKELHGRIGGWLEGYKLGLEKGRTGVESGESVDSEELKKGVKTTA